MMMETETGIHPVHNSEYEIRIGNMNTENNMMESPKARCRLKGCLHYVPPEGYYYGMPQSHCPRCGMKTWCASKECSDFEEPSYPLPD